METSNTIITKTEYSAAEKQALVSDWKQSGKTMMSFSRTIGVNYHTFINWIKPKKKKKRAKAGNGKLGYRYFVYAFGCDMRNGYDGRATCSCKTLIERLNKKTLMKRFTGIFSPLSCRQ